MGFRYGFKAEANRISLRVREQVGVSAVAPIDPLDICDHFEIKLIPLSRIHPESPFLSRAQSSFFSAVTVPCGGVTAIVHNDSHHPYRQRSNITHELAHCFLGHACTPPLTATGERHRDSRVEAEANFLSGALLMPNAAAIYVVRQGLVSQAQGLYGISEAMLSYRLKVSGAQVIHARAMAARNAR